MPKMRGETNEEWMERLRQYRMMERTRAAVGFCNGKGGSEAHKMAAFLSIFHPEIEVGSLQYIQLMNDARNKDAGR